MKSDNVNSFQSSMNDRRPNIVNDSEYRDSSCDNRPINDLC